MSYGRGCDQIAPDLPDPPKPVDGSRHGRHLRNSWAELMRRAFGYDLLLCPDCGGKMALIACILERGAIRRILAHLGLPTEPPVAAAARASPGEPLFDDFA